MTPDQNPSTSPSHGTHKIFLGFAAGVGKTFALLDEAQRRVSRGQDIVVGALDTHKRKPTEDQAAGIPVIPTKDSIVDGRAYHDLDVKAIIARHPESVIVDDLAYSNAPNSEHEKRWEDVEEILNAGINVLSTVNVQHLESLNDHVADITGVHVKETVPDHILKSAAELEMIDLTPRALINRLERGDIYPAEDVSEAREKWFLEGNLSALRELAMREAAGRVDEDVTEYRRQNKIEKPWAATDKVMICLSASHSSMRLLRRGWRTGQRLHGAVVAVHVEEKPLDEKEQRIIQDDEMLAKRLQVPVVRLKGKVADQLIEFAREKSITQIVIGHSLRSSLQQRLRSSIIVDLIRELKTIDILVVAAEAE